MQISNVLRQGEGGYLFFMCPGCKHRHGVKVEQVGVGPVWEWDQNADSPSFWPSIFVNPPGRYHSDSAPSCHSFVRDGHIHFLGDCTHELVGRTVPLPNVNDWVH